MIRGVPLLALALAACSDKVPEATAEGSASAEQNAKTIPCALGGATEFKPDCSVEDTTVDGKLFWIVRHPDGGFRRFQMIDNGTRIATADGADEVEMTRDGGEFIVKAGPDRYRFPAAPEPVQTSAAAN